VVVGVVSYAALFEIRCSVAVTSQAHALTLPFSPPLPGCRLDIASLCEANDGQFCRTMLDGIETRKLNPSSSPPTSLDEIFPRLVVPRRLTRR